MPSETQILVISILFILINLKLIFIKYEEIKNISDDNVYVTNKLLGNTSIFTVVAIFFTLFVITYFVIISNRGYIPSALMWILIVAEFFEGAASNFNLKEIFPYNKKQFVFNKFFCFIKLSVFFWVCFKILRM
jgi:hypothetical protein